MKLTSCRVQNFRSIIDSGWVDIDDIGVIVGKNESGKTSFLKALWKFNPFNNVGYNIDREWPSGKRREKSAEKIVVETTFSFNPDEIAKIEAIHESAKGINAVKISRKYSGQYAHTFQPTDPSTEHSLSWVVDLMRDRIAEPLTGFSDYFKQQYRSRVTALLAEVEDQGGTDYALRKLPELKEQVKAFCHPSHPHHQQDHGFVSSLGKAIDGLIAEVEKTPLLRVIDYVHEILPTFIYMDDHQIFSGSAHLDEVLKHKSAENLSAEEETVLVILKMAGLDLEQEVAKGNGGDKTQRNLDMDDASSTLTNLIADNWRQRRYQVEFRADGQHFNTYVKDHSDRALVLLEDRSKGFQWFFSFDMKFMYETDGRFRNAIILLDEPGLHLHAAAQRDLLERMKAYAKGNQLFYTTHLPFMIDFKRLDNIYVAEEIQKQGAMVHRNWATADKDARFTLQAALGLSWSQSLFVGQFNLVVEGVDDFWFLTVFSSMFEEAGQPGLDQRLVVTPAGGASKVAYVGTILKGQELNVAVLLDSDTAGQQAFEHLVHQWILQEKLIVKVGDAVGAAPCALEDLFGEGYYVGKVTEAYSKELGGKPLALNPKTAGKVAIVDRVSEAFAGLGLGEYNKGRVAKRIMTDLGKKRMADVDSETAAKYRKVIDAINGVAAAWK